MEITPVSGLLLLAAGTFLCATGDRAAARSAPIDATPKIVLSPCRSLGLAEEVQCGALEVYENRSAGSGRKIHLKVMVLPATEMEDRADPVFFFAGGPGEPSTDEAPWFAGPGKELRRHSDIVLVDFRGTGGSSPLTCKEMTGSASIQGFLDNFLPEDAVRACRQRLEGSADFSQYTTDNAVDDVDDVRAALGYDRINLMGASYGTRAVLAYVRRHEKHVRSAVLIGVDPTYDRSPLTFARDAQNALDGLFAECAADANCGHAYPTLREDLEKLFKQLDAKPAVVDVMDAATGKPMPLTLTRQGAAQTIRYMLYVPVTAALIPMSIHEGAQGNFKPLAGTANMFAEQLGGSQISDGFFLCVTCAEDVPWIKEEEIAAAVQGTFLGNFRIRQQQAACRQWTVPKVAPEFLAPVHADIPVLILSGERDPVTPPQWGAEVARELPHSRQIVIADAGHSFEGMQGIECVDRLVVAFLQAGSVDGLDTSCISGIKSPEFETGQQTESVVALSAEDLQRVVGAYREASSGLEVSIKLEGDRLILSLPGRPALALNALSTLRFSFAGLPSSYGIQFTTDGDLVTGMTLQAGPAETHHLSRKHE